MIRRLSGFFVVVLFVSGCAGTPASDARKFVDFAQDKSARVVLTSTTILADITRQVAGDRLPVESLLPVESDPHSYQATPQDLARISESELIITNGAGYEQFLESVLHNADGERTLIEASTGVGLRKDAEHGVDPHGWLDPNLVLVYVENIREGLTHFDPDGEAVYKSNADVYAAELEQLDAWIVEQVNGIPAEKRLLVTNHEAFGYFAERYGFTIVGTVVESFSSDASPSAQQLAALIDQIESSGAPAIFLDASDNTLLARQIAEETSVNVVTDLHLESLTEGSPAGTYIDMMKDNVSKIVDALK